MLAMSTNGDNTFVLLDVNLKLSATITKRGF